MQFKVRVTSYTDPSPRLLAQLGSRRSSPHLTPHRCVSWGGCWGGSLACTSALGSLTSSVAPSSAAASASGSQHRMQSVLQAQRNKDVGTSHPRQTPQTRLAVTPASTWPLPPIRREPQSVGFPTTQVWLRLFLEAGKETSVVPHYEKLKVAQNPQTATLPFSSLTTRFLQAHEGRGVPCFRLRVPP